jgi:hypothetical protein
MRFDERVAKHLKTVEKLQKLAVEADCGQKSSEFKEEYRDVLLTFVRASGNMKRTAMSIAEDL